MRSSKVFRRASRSFTSRIVARVEQIDDQLGDIGIARERLLHVILAEGEAGLAQEFGGRAQDGDVAPGQACADDQTIEAVAFRFARHDGVKRFFQRRLDVGEIGGRSVGALHQEIEHGGVALPAVAGLERDGIGIFRDHLEAEILEHRQRSRERQHGAQHIELESQRRMRDRATGDRRAL